MPWRFDPTRVLMICFTVLLLVCTVQVSWWIIDQFLHTTEVRATVDRFLEADIQAAQALIEQGWSHERIERLFGGLLVVTSEGEVVISPEIEAELREESASRRRRYAWEGGFFFVVLLSCIAVILRSLKADASLHRRQHNFLAAVSHEFKSPLSSARLAAETLSLRDPDPERRKKLVTRVLKNLARLDRMVVNLLDTAKIEDGALQLSEERVVLERAVRTAAEDQRDRFAHAGGQLELKVPTGIEILADPRAVDTVLQNLLDNARKALGHNEGGRVLVRAERDGRYAELVVEDTGVGFAAEEAAKLFEKFYRPGDEMRRSGHGSGLGLYIVHKLVGAAGGTVRAESDGIGTGARFVVRWPLAEERA